MEEDTKDLLEEEIESEFEKLKALDPGSKEHTAAVEDLAKLYRLKLEETENDRKYQESCDRDIVTDRNWKLECEKFEEQSRNQYITMGIKIAEIVLPLTFYGIWMNRGLKFEETGSFTSSTFRGLFSRFKPTNK